MTSRQIAQEPSEGDYSAQIYQDSHSEQWFVLFVFRFTPKKLWCTTQNWRCNIDGEQSLHDQLNRRRNRRSFAAKCFFQQQLSLVFEGPHGGLLFCFEHIRIDLWFVTCDDLINVFWSTAIVFLQHFYAPRAFFERLRHSASTKVFYGQLFIQYRMYVCGRNAQG